MEIDLISAGKRIKEIRQQHKYSMALFSKLVGNSSASTVNNWEKGNNLPKPDRLEKLAILGNTTADWIRYGEFEEYVARLLSEANLRKNLTDDQFQQLLQELKKRKFTYTQDLNILTTANELFPDLFETSYQMALSSENNVLISEDSTTYRIEQNDRYRTDFLPMIEELLYDSNEKETHATVLFQTFDLLKRTEKNKHFPSLPPIFAILSEIVTNDISYKNRATSKIVEYTDLIKQPNKGKPLPEKVVKEQYAQAKNNLVRLLDDFYSEYNKE
ncbi:helix-turn-helix domain-containing protein [Candidatus Enterococcus ikei]|uniref:Helix-turn-helix transcriptional regulator n=1 Tax=Candidatus Enterococcus ikei TaxID=2815326 RepID=A0ABS3GWN0_9ENTE|nr:helix-turn-helix transcriptional regulator [Enterococcus sp. DIV0869a]MBO0439676.1 helix-turn-helix transcriptional regulator [Enterococcus sp. DIV0869a]